MLTDPFAALPVAFRFATTPIEGTEFAFGHAPTTNEALAAFGDAEGALYLMVRHRLAHPVLAHLVGVSALEVLPAGLGGALVAEPGSSNHDWTCSPGFARRLVAAPVGGRFHHVRTWTRQDPALAAHLADTSSQMAMSGRG